LFDGKDFNEFGAAVVPGIRTHGTGCTLSAAIAANLALGHDLVESVRRAKRFVAGAIRGAVRIGSHDVLNI
jgi:hydroxymethylpyrimidine/phosphomethylpyrimidine kinase